jgi:Zn-dependent alcohol dehydrogenase
MPVETRVALMRAPHKPMTIETAVLADPGPRQVMVRMAVAGLCSSDVMQHAGDWDSPLPMVLGHEGSGVIEQVGPGVTELVPGQRVMLTCWDGCGACKQCRTGNSRRCPEALAAVGRGEIRTGPSPLTVDGEKAYVYGALGSFSERVVVGANNCIPIADEVPMNIAASSCTTLSGVGSAINTLNIPSGSSGAIIGVGQVGINSVLGAKLRGAGEIVAIDVEPKRLEHAAKYGATRTILATDEAAIQELRANSYSDGFDWSIVTAPEVDAMQLGLQVVGPGGIMCFAAWMPANSPVPIDFTEPLNMEKTMVASNLGSQDAHVLGTRILNAYVNGSLPLEAALSKSFPLEEINEAFDYHRTDGSRLTPLITFEADM